ncbi:MAG: metal ABC transporter permease [Halobacteriovoraceae bacterium]|nr:metal ABC transporter permease [Halobacteriovoraceae bacterium]MCB9095625.1 metal ABC transporter permease [Halobacteriovoraceae bacterium]
METINFFLAPFCMCLILVGIHCYLGLHVLKRGVIFVDLSLAQVAGLGTTVALLFHVEHHSTGSYFISLGHTFAVAALFAWARKFDKKISQEVLIGITYALASALVILVVNNLSHGTEHIKEILVGHILWVTWSDVIKTGAIYAAVSLVHYYFRKPIIAVSFGDDLKDHSKWDFLFFALFGVVITSSVGVAGILLVFSFLIVPALISTFFRSDIKGRLIFGWIFGFIVCILGMVISYLGDLPAGAVLVVCFTAIPILMLPILGKLQVR